MALVTDMANSGSNAGNANGAIKDSCANMTNTASVIKTPILESTANMASIAPQCRARCSTIVAPLLCPYSAHGVATKE